MTTYEFIKKMREHLTPDGMWMQGDYSDTGQSGAELGFPCCILGAAHYVLAHADPKIKEIIIQTVAITIEKNIPDKNFSMVDFNDSRKTTQKDILDLLDQTMESIS